MLLFRLWFRKSSDNFVKVIQFPNLRDVPVLVLRLNDDLLLQCNLFCNRLWRLHLTSVHDLVSNRSCFLLEWIWAILNTFRRLRVESWCLILPACIDCSQLNVFPVQFIVEIVILEVAISWSVEAFEIASWSRIFKHASRLTSRFVDWDYLFISNFEMIVVVLIAPWTRALVWAEWVLNSSFLCYLCKSSTHFLLLIFIMILCDSFCSTRVQIWIVMITYMLSCLKSINMTETDIFEVEIEAIVVFENELTFE